MFYVIHMKHQVLFSIKKTMQKYSRLSSAAVLIGTLRVYRIYDRAESRKSQSKFQTVEFYARLAEHKT